MNRSLIAVVVVGLMAAGCAVGIEEPEPGPVPRQAQTGDQDPAVTTFSAEVEESTDMTEPLPPPDHEFADIPQFERPAPSY